MRLLVMEHSFVPGAGERELKKLEDVDLGCKGWQARDT